MRSALGALLTTVTILFVQSTLLTTLEAQAARQGRAGAGQPDVNGFKVGDTVEVDTAFGWADAQIVAIAGNNYQVRISNGVVVSKTYPIELHRKGPFTDRDRAMGLYDMKDRVQVNVQGKGWVEGTVILRRALEYQVQFPGNLTAWASGDNIRFVGAPVAATGPKTGTPPKPGFVSCAGKIEGRYASTSGFGSITLLFEKGKATLTAGFGDAEVAECWTMGDKIILRKPGSPEQDMPLDINNDGTIQTPFGELKKKSG